MYGDTAAGRKRVTQLREQGGDIRALAALLVSQAEAVPWHGKAADAMRERIKDRASHLRTAAAHHETAADSLARPRVPLVATPDTLRGLYVNRWAAIGQKTYVYNSCNVEKASKGLQSYKAMTNTYVDQLAVW